MISIKVIANDVDSSEHDAAEALKKIFERDVNSSESGEIFIFPNVTCYGQKVKDIDIVVFGQFQNLARKVFLSPSSEKMINIQSFCFCFEVKDHVASGIEFTAQSTKVRYKGKWHDATHQSEQQKYSLKDFLDDSISWSPYICNFIWLRNLSHLDLPTHKNNLLSAGFNFSDLIEKACIKNSPKNSDGAYTLSCTWRKNGTFRDLEEAFSLFLKAQKPENIGRLTREKLEKITKQAILKDQKYARSIGEKLVVIRGRAGTGKTIKLLHIAYDLYSKHNQRCLILTYNKALVSDINRLIALAKVDSGIAARTISVQTIHSFIYGLMISFRLIESGSNEFMPQYEELKAELLALIKSGLERTKDIQSLMESGHDSVAWEKILIDEGQDWPEDEKEILFAIFDSKDFIIADGVDQLVRDKGKYITKWTDKVIHHTPIIPEKKSLRQTRNLCRFVQKYAEYNEIEWNLKSKEDLNGGRVIILAKDYNHLIHKDLLSDCKESGNQPYEMLFLIPPSLVRKVRNNQRGETREFALIEQWTSWGIKIWDGTSANTRSEYPKDVLEHRVLQYDSCRGLEGWITVCLWMDEFFEYKMETFTETDQEQLSLGLLTEDEQRKYTHRWIMIALTRAIDTVVITLKNPNSRYAKILRDISESCPDFVEWID